MTRPPKPTNTPYITCREVLDFIMAYLDGELTQAAGSGGTLVDAWHEPFLGRLFGDAHALADLGPRRARPAGLVDEMADHVVSQLAEALGDGHRGGDVAEGVIVGVLVAHVGDEFDEPSREGSHTVNSTLTISASSTPS